MYFLHSFRLLFVVSVPLGSDALRLFAGNGASPSVGTATCSDANGNPKCMMTYVSHSGLGNQLFGLQRAARVAEYAGCGLVMAPVLNHGDIAYGYHTRCTEETHEADVIKAASALYPKRELRFDHLFRMRETPRLCGHFSTRMSDLSALPQLPVNCSTPDLLGGSQERFTTQLQDFIHQHNASGYYTMGSGFEVEAPGGKVPLGELFSGFSQIVQDAADVIKTRLVGEGGGGYGCIHLRAGDHGEEEWYEHLGNWVFEQSEAGGLLQTEVPDDFTDAQLRASPYGRALRMLCKEKLCLDTDGNADPDPSVTTAKITSKSPSVERTLLPLFRRTLKNLTSQPLFVMSPMPDEFLQAILKPVCTPEGSWRCVEPKDVIHPEDSARLNFPESGKMYQSLMLETAVCSQADFIYLPGAGRFVARGISTPLAKDPNRRFSTLSKLVDMLAPIVHQ